MTMLVMLLSVFLQAPAAAPVVVVFETEVGKFEVAVDVAHAPVTAANFLKYVDAGAYTNGFFHRTVRSDTEVDAVNPIQVIQASRARGAAGFPPIALERTSVTGLKHLAGTLSMARAGVDSGASDFFVCVTDTPSLDFGGARNADGQGFAAFGQIVSGMDVIKKIQAAPTRPGAEGRTKQNLTPPIGILKAYRK
ncbi:MAG: peptidylprolyl isomerase [Acidobacteria bacterium]|nr:peptidylprolyl isomerase [Acidobacteriota bacterium]